MVVTVENMEDNDWRDLASVIFTREMLRGELPIKTLAKLSRIVVFMAVSLPDTEMAFETYFDELYRTVKSYLAEPDGYEADYAYIISQTQRLVETAVQKSLRRTGRRKHKEAVSG